MLDKIYLYAVGAVLGEHLARHRELRLHEGLATLRASGRVVDQ